MKPSLSTNHHTKMEIPGDLVWIIYSKICEKTTSWTNPCFDILEYGIRTICNYFLMRQHWSGGSRKGKYVHSLISNQNLILVTFTHLFFYCRSFSKFIHGSAMEINPLANKLKRPLRNDENIITADLQSVMFVSCATCCR